MKNLDECDRCGDLVDGALHWLAFKLCADCDGELIDMINDFVEDQYVRGHGCEERRRS